ncbi:vesicle-associated membrane protein 8-like [Toxotes jaculatrix]|uniref:vesicle-associated membrane protein 8-like n=1 Tax=Toxotes jaculatrix TaxID=941984 RepID=UPI001B3A955B|nr:vesicle-associated membrane protein 8-like [Toxotes jaculatrix]
MEQGAVAAEPAPQNKVQTLRNEIDEVTDKMKENMQRIIERELKTADLVTQSEEMEAGAQHFKQTSQKVARSYWWKNVKLIVAIVVVVLIIVLIIVLLATGVIPTNVTQTSTP